jgi:hypothetical protein
MAQAHEIRADYDRDTIVIYQAYAAVIALPALAKQRFVPPFSFGRMTWIKPSFLWLMHRSNWGRKSGQEHTLAVRITRAGWERALSLGVLTTPEATIFPTRSQWERQFREATVHIQWDPERSLRGGSLPHGSIQVGLSRHIIREFVETWVVAIEDFTQRDAKIRGLLQSGNATAAQRQLPPEKVYSVSPEIGRRIGITRAD